MRAMLLLLFVVACGDPTEVTPDAGLPARCTEATAYLGEPVYCLATAEMGLCVLPKYNGPNKPTCRRLCAETGSLCRDGEWITSTLTTSAEGRKSVCYCEPAWDPCAPPYSCEAGQ